LRKTDYLNEKVDRDDDELKDKEVEKTNGDSEQAIDADVGAASSDGKDAKANKKVYHMPDEDFEDVVPFDIGVVRGIGSDVATLKTMADNKRVTMNNKELDLLKWVGAYCLKSIMTNKVFDEKMASGDKLFSWGANDDMAFGILCLENYLNKWMAIGRIEYRLNRTLTNVDIEEMKLRTKWPETNGLSGKEAQERYVQLRNYISRLAKNEVLRNELEDGFKEYYGDTFGEEVKDSKVPSGGSKKGAEMEYNDEMGDDFDEEMSRIVGAGDELVCI
jgi:hypothetical protein